MKVQILDFPRPVMIPLNKMLLDSLGVTANGLIYHRASNRAHCLNQIGRSYIGIDDAAGDHPVTVEILPPGTRIEITI